MGGVVFRIDESTEINQISLTGVRSIVLIGLLIVAPRSLEEIRKIFIDLKIMEETHSDDILRIDLNTIKAMGCEISRSSKKTNNKYVLYKHPFSLTIPEDQINALKKAYKKIKEDAGLPLLLEYDELFKKIAFHMCDEKTKDALLGVSILKYSDVEIIKELYSDCKQNRTIELIYQKPTSKEEAKKEIIAKNIVLENDKIFLHGFDLEKKKPVVLNISRIKRILSRKFSKENIEIKTTKIKYFLSGKTFSLIENCEKIIEQKDDGCVIEGSYHNEFIAMQRVLSFGSKCTVLEPTNFRNSIIDKLIEMRRIYGE